MGITADDGQAEDTGRRLVVLVVSGALGADRDIANHAPIVPEYSALASWAARTN